MKDVKTTIFNSIVNNAVDFLYQSVLEVEESPKYSLINFYNAIELFLKARLMLEHWALVWSEPQNAHLEKFLQGDLNSVGIDEIRKRLENICNVKITKKEYETFNELRKERNKLVHFFNPKYMNISTNLTQEVVVSQCKAWFYLHHILTKRWREEFKEYLSTIRLLHKLMRKQRAFLQGRFEERRPDIEKGRKKGQLLTNADFEESPALDQIYHIIAFAELQKGEIGKIETRIKQEIDRLDTEHEVQQEINDFWG